MPAPQEVVGRGHASALRHLQRRGGAAPGISHPTATLHLSEATATFGTLVPYSTAGPREENQ